MTTITIKVQDDQKLDKIISLLNTIGIKMAEAQDQIDLLTLQVQKVFTEVTTLKANLEASIADLEGQIAAGTSVDLTSLKAAVQAIDDIVPDSVA